MHLWGIDALMCVGKWNCVMCGEVERCDVWRGGGTCDVWEVRSLVYGGRRRSVMCGEAEECDVLGGGGV